MTLCLVYINPDCPGDKNVNEIWWKNMHKVPEQICVHRAKKSAIA